MNPPAFFAMKYSFQALVWEQVWKNRIVFPMLVLLLILGAWLTHLLAGADPGVWWLPTAQRTLLTAFFASVLLSFAPFTLMESHHGWRMNSMVTRWFVLPVRTSLLVLIPFVAACAIVGLFLGTWMLFFHRLTPELDFLHVLLSLLLGVAVMQTLAWILPRKPTQFWPVLALWFMALMIITLLPLDGAHWEPQRRFVRTVAPFLIPLLGVVAYTAARLNRCGVWTGEMPLSGLWRWLFRGQPTLPAVKTPAGALFWSDVVPIGLTFIVTWTVFLLMLVAIQMFLFFSRSNSREISLAVVLQVIVVLTPPLGVLWLAVGGLFLGSEPGTGFRTLLSPFRAARPVSAGTLAAQRLLAAASLWLLVWVPWLVLLVVHTHLHPRWAEVDIPEIHATAGRLLAISAHALIGALPLFLWGRLEGFPNMLLAAIVAWAGTWGLAGFCRPPDTGNLPWIPLLVLLAVKLCLGFTALGWGWRAGHITWRYAASLTSGWLVLVSLLVWGFPTWSQRGCYGLITIALLMPFARLALAPLALAANRTR